MEDFSDIYIEGKEVLIKKLEDLRQEFGGDKHITIDVWDDGEGNDPETTIIMGNEEYPIGDNVFALAMEFTGDSAPLDTFLKFVKNIVVTPSSEPYCVELNGPENETIANFESGNSGMEAGDYEDENIDSVIKEKNTLVNKLEDLKKEFGGTTPITIDAWNMSSGTPETNIIMENKEYNIGYSHFSRAMEFTGVSAPIDTFLEFARNIVVEPSSKPGCVELNGPENAVIANFKSGDPDKDLDEEADMDM